MIERFAWIAFFIAVPLSITVHYVGWLGIVGMVVALVLAWNALVVWRLRARARKEQLI